MRVLIVEDEPNLGRQLRSTLEGAGYAVDLATDGEDGHYLGSTENYDVGNGSVGCNGFVGF
jgi:two-component system OmpR family response regulator